jgi:hypothetical protein
LNIGRPWAPNATCDHLLVSLPFPYGPALENCQIGDHTVRLRWLLPITQSEAAFANAHGYEALEERLEAAAIIPVDIRRKSVV